MDRQTIQELLHRRPFEPFEVHLSSGEVHQVHNPEFAVLLRSNLFIGYPNSNRFALCSLLHIVGVQPASDGQAAG